MKFSTSINIERDQNKALNYIVTANAKKVIRAISSSFDDGIHSFSLIGSYGTGKSTFLLEFEHCLAANNQDALKLLKLDGQFNGFTKFRFLNIVGDYMSLEQLLEERLPTTPGNALKRLNALYSETQKQNEFLVIVVDEFGKILEHAAKGNPEEEMYFLQKLTEFANDTEKNVLLLTTLHQSFTAYSKDLSKSQRQEWTKVKGRFQEIVFSEPVEQLLQLAAERIKCRSRVPKNAETIFSLAQKSNLLAHNVQEDIANKLYPLDVIAAYVLTLANQRYGQNERTFFTFLESTGEDSLSAFEPKKNLMYNLSDVHDYILYHFNSYLSSANADSAQWTALKIARERVEGSNLSESDIVDGLKLVKTIGLLNLFASSGTVIDANFIVEYASLAMNMANVKPVLDELISLNIIRFAKYKSKYILYEGTDVDLDLALNEAENHVRRNTDVVSKLHQNFNFKVALANAYYYKTGTPRYFEYHLTEIPITTVADGEADGYINLIFSNNVDDIRDQVLEQKGTAILYCLYKNIKSIADVIFSIDKLQWVKDFYIADETDKVAIREIDKQIQYEQNLLTKTVSESMFDPNGVEWYFNGHFVENIVDSKSLTKYLSEVSSFIYDETPTFKNELVNKFKPSGTISTARQIFFNQLLEHSSEENLGFPKDKFPPEKSIYLSLLKENGLHRQMGNAYALSEPSEESSFNALWKRCNDFLVSSQSRQRKLTELVKILQQPPLRLKKGLIDFWLPVFLMVKKEEYALYSNGRYVPGITKEVLDLFQKNLNQFSIKAFSMSGVKMDFFQQYRKAISLSADTALSEGSFVETIKPILSFYRHLNTFAKTTKVLSPNAKNFRDVVAHATDPEKTFFEELPDKLGFKEVVVMQNPDAIDSFVDVLQGAIRELRSCYDNLISKIEDCILETLKIKEKEYSIYKDSIDGRYKNVKGDLMSEFTKRFHSRVVAQFPDKKLWIESISYVVLNKALETIKDEEIPFLLTSIKEAFFDLDDYVEMHKVENESVARVHITLNREGSVTKQVILPQESNQEIEKLTKQIEKMLSKDDSLNISALLTILKNKMK